MKTFKQVTGLSLDKTLGDPAVQQYLIENKGPLLPSLLEDVYDVRDFGIWREEEDFGLGLTLQHRKATFTADSLEALTTLLSQALQTFTIIALGDMAYVVAGKKPDDLGIKYVN